MAHILCRNRIRHRHTAGEPVERATVTDSRDRCAPPEKTNEELYRGITREVFMIPCCDARRGCFDFDADCRCKFWPTFAHPRWLDCKELYRCRKI
ncbi:MAG: hypothetical protein FWG94_13670 [Oscillospiraceae bacterium]|nr:hypothetical protein [Oscillospiraceae bacterium]